MIPLKIALITNIPAPYRIPLYDKIAKKFDGDFIVFYCAKTEPNRKWDVGRLAHNHIFLKGRVFRYKGRYIYFNPEIWKRLKDHDPSVVITVGFNPTMLLGWLYTVIYRKRHIPMSDGWLKSEANLSKLHFFIRKVVYKYSDAFIGASRHTISMFEHYGILKEKIFRSPLCIDNKKFGRFINTKKEYDIIFSGQFIERKMPFFSLEIVKKLKEYKRDLRILLIGSGPLEDKILKELNESKIDYDFPGFVQQENLPKYYASSKLLLFPTQSDPWGIIANEASAVGTPVITCDNAGVANDLIIDGVTGFVLPLDSDLWAEKTLELLNDKNLYNKISRAAIEKVQEYNFDVATEGFIKACEKLLEA